jgi:hypothetical protein
MAKNHAAKRRTVDAPYEVWVEDEFEVRVLKKQHAITQQYTRWLVAVRSQHTSNQWDGPSSSYGQEIESKATLVWRDPEYAQASGLPIVANQPTSPEVAGVAGVVAAALTRR